MKKLDLKLVWPLLLVAIVAVTMPSCSKKKGCTDPLSLNYDADAEEDDGSCEYAMPITLSCSTISSDRTLTKVTGAVPDYIVPCVISIEADLAIEPGVIIWFESDAGFITTGSGSLKAVGNDSMRIVFRGENEGVGTWKGLYFNSNSVLNELSYVTISGGGNSSFDGAADKVANIRVNAGKKLRLHNSIVENSGADGLRVDGLYFSEEEPIALFRNNTFRNNSDYPINTIAPSVAAIDSTGSTYTGNGQQFIKIDGGHPVGTHEWHKNSIPYLMTIDVYAENLLVHPGTTIKFGADVGLSSEEYGSGYLRMIGTAANPVTLTGENEAPGAWQGIAFQSNNVQNRLEYVNISYGGSEGFTGAGYRANVVVGGFSQGTAEIVNCNISDSDDCGIFVSMGSTLTESGNTFTGNSGNSVCNQ